MRYRDHEEAERLGAEPWQLALLDANPAYLGWGPHEDYMWNEGEGWNSSVITPTWKEFGPWALNDLNECVNFYFSIKRESAECSACKGKGVESTCPLCNGNGQVFVGPPAHVSLTLWWLHPRKGCSRGIEITRVEREELPDVRRFLEAAAQRNADRFAGIERITQETEA